MWKTRPARATQPPTYTAGEVARLLHGEIDPGGLPSWDRKGLLRPSYYEDPSADSGLVPRAEHDAGRGRPSRGDRHRRYTFADIVWIRFFLQVRREMVSRHRRSP